MRITNAAEYAIRAVLKMAMEPDRVYTATELFVDIEAPQKFLSKILQKLAQKKILSSTRGIKGGFKIKKPIDTLTLFDIIEAIDGPMALNKCLLDGFDCSREKYCPVHLIWEEAQLQLKKILTQKSIKDIVNEYRKMVGKNT
ncbi:MAG: Rrf2 family transcriptional regulator [Proteobacteria bacterium]|nr:Rrf2 family transcriptional regulator [Pseudomonadota bacterium]